MIIEILFLNISSASFSQMNKLLGVSINKIQSSLFLIMKEFGLIGIFQM